jgi:hypothetical protein
MKALGPEDKGTGLPGRALKMELAGNGMITEFYILGF